MYNTTRQTAASARTNLVKTQGWSFSAWLNYSLEGLWLTAAFLVPLMFLSQDYAVSEAKIAYVEVPKVALLRTIAGLMAILWALDWAYRSKAPEQSSSSFSFRNVYLYLLSSQVWLGLRQWLQVHPTRWFICAAILFFGSTFLSTVLSGSLRNSIWGEIPGQDSYSAYTIASYLILFSVIATRLKSRSQLARLLGSLVLMGTLVGLYGIFQHYGHDFFEITEATGGGDARVTGFMGNAIFAAAVLSMTVPITLVAAATNLLDENFGESKLRLRLEQLCKDSVFTFLWALILAVQLLGLIFTFTRGAWGGTVLALVIFLIIVVLSLGSRMLIRTSLVLGLSAVLVVAFLHWQDDVSVLNLGSWLGFIMALLGLIGTFAVLYVIKEFRRGIVFILAAGAILTIVIASVLTAPALSGLGSTDSPISGAESTSNKIVERISLMKTEVLGGSFGGRSTHWKASWELIKDRPWFEFDDLQLTSLRPFIGYGPDLFRYTYLLKSPSEEKVGAGTGLPLEADHAHNFFLHQTVEQGILGGVASLALFVSVFGVGCHHLLRRRQKADPMYRLLLFGLVSVILGRFFEMMFGVARISDLTVLWVLFGLFAALAIFDDGRQEASKSVAVKSNKRTGLSSRRTNVRASGPQSFSTAMIFRLAIVAWLVGGIGIVTWQKSINSVRASVAEGNGVKHFQNIDFENSIKDFDKAIKLAPGVTSYYSNRANVFLTYQMRPETYIEPGCAQQVENSYQACLGLQAFNINLESANQQPFNFKPTILAGNSAANLGLKDTALELYQTAVNMVPNSFLMRNTLAEIQIELGFYDEALEELDRSLGITGESIDSAAALQLKGRIFWEIDQYDDAIQALKHSLSVEYSPASFNLLHNIYTMEGVINDIGYFDTQINENSNDSVAFYFRGLAHRELGNTNEATSDMKTANILGINPGDVIEKNRIALSIKTKSDALLSISYLLHIGPDDKRYESALMRIGQTYLDLGSWKEAAESFTELISLSTNNAISYRKRGDALFALKRYEEAIKDYEQAASLNSLDSANFTALGKVNVALGNYESARLHFNQSIQLDPNSSDAYAARGFQSVQTGDYSTGLPDIDQAIKLSPKNHDAYFKKAQAYIGLDQTSLALENLDKAITLAPLNADYYYSRGLFKNQMSWFESAILDFSVSIQLNNVLANYDPRYAKPHVQIGIAYVQTDRPESALSHANVALELLEHKFNTPEWNYYKPTINLQLSDVHMLLGDSYTALDRPGEAQNEYEQSSRYR